MRKTEELYQLYADEYSKKFAYEKGYKQISEADLLETISLVLDDMIEQEGSLQEYADLDEPKVVLNLYSIEEAVLLKAYLQDKTA